MTGGVQGDDIGALRLRLLAQEAVRRPGGVRPRHRQGRAAPHLQQHRRGIQGVVTLIRCFLQA